MKIFSQITAFLLVILLLMAGSVSAQGNGMSIDYSFDVEYNTLLVRVDIASSRGKIPVVMRVTRTADNEIVAVEQAVTASASDGVVSYEFTAIPFSSNAPSGDYEIYVSADIIHKSSRTVFEYKGIDKRIQLLDKVNKAIAKASTKELLDAIYVDDGNGTGENILEIDTQVFTNLSEKASLELAGRLIAKGKYILPVEVAEDGSFPELSDEDIETVQNHISLLTGRYNEALKFALIQDMDSDTEFKAYISAYGGDNFYTDDAKTAYDEKEAKEYLESAMKLSGFYERLKDEAPSADDFDSLKDIIYKAGFLELIEYGRYTDIREIVEKFTGLFTVDTTAFSKLSDEKQTEVYQDMASVDAFVDTSDFIDKFDTAVADKIPGRANSGGSSGGGSVSSKGNVEVDKELLPIAVGSSFSDLDSCEWAREAIEDLYSKKVVAGRGNGIFDPFASVTRAEFVKMVVEAFNVSEVSYDSQFADVSADSWYAPYVAAASHAGIVKGSNGFFNPTGKITREDMAVILARLLDYKPSSEIREVFTDSYLISDYAVEAVFAMYENGITKGKGDGRFDPKNTASRAEAAQMIYKAMK